MRDYKITRRACVVTRRGCTVGESKQPIRCIITARERTPSRHFTSQTIEGQTDILWAAETSGNGSLYVWGGVGGGLWGCDGREGRGVVLGGSGVDRGGGGGLGRGEKKLRILFLIKKRRFATASQPHRSIAQRNI